MYEEGHRGFVFKNIVLKLLLIFIIVFLIIWLFPTKNYVESLIDQRIGTGTSQVFNANIETMKNAATSYFSGDRLPSKVGSSKTLTLKEMVDKKLLVEFTDSNNKKCDYKKSYAEVTKNKKDYSLKVNLTCSDKKAYINSYISLNQCTSDVCSKKKVDENSCDVSSEEDSIENDKNSISCEYVKKTSGYYSYGAWSGWSTSYVSSSNSRQVETKQDKVQTGTILEQSGTTKHTQVPKKVTLTKDGKQYIVYVCPSDFDNGGSYNNYVTCVKTIPNYVNKPTYRTTTYYRYRDGKYVNGGNSYKWASCDDKSLKSQGYKETGKTR